MTSPFVEQLSAMRGQIATNQRRRVVLKKADVTAVDTVANTFTATFPDGVVLAGITSPAQFLPDVGDEVAIQIEGATPTYVPGGVAALSLGDREVGSLGFDRLSTGTLTGNAVLAANILSAVSGQRAGITPIGIQAFNDSEQETVRLDGNANLIMGVTQTAPDGQRRIVMGADGNTGQIQLVAENGSVTEVRGYTESGVEAIRLGAPIQGTWEGWNSIQAQDSERIYISSGDIRTTFGGDTGGTHQFIIYEGDDSGSPGVQPTRVERFKLDAARVVMRAPDVDTNVELINNVIRFFVGAQSTEGSIDIVRHGVADTRNRSPRIQLRAEGGTQASNLKYVIDGDGTDPRIEVTNTADSAYGAIWASAFTVSSSEAGKEEITDVSLDGAVTVLESMRPRSWRVRLENGQLSAPRFGLVAEEAPGEVVEGQAEAINLYSLAGVQVAVLKRAVAQIRDLRQEVNGLKTRLAALEAKVP